MPLSFSVTKTDGTTAYLFLNHIVALEDVPEGSTETFSHCRVALSGGQYVCVKESSKEILDSIDGFFTRYQKKDL